MSAKVYVFLFLLVMCTCIQNANINAMRLLMHTSNDTSKSSSNRTLVAHQSSLHTLSAARKLSAYDDNDECPYPKPRIISIRAEGDSSHNYVDDSTGHTVIRTNKRSQLRLSGINLFQEDIEIGLTTFGGDYGTQCFPSLLDIELQLINNYTMLAFVTLKSSTTYYLCITDLCHSEFKIFEHQGRDDWITLTSEGALMPLWLHILVIILLLVLSGLFSGLNLGLMALDKNELKVIERCGTEAEKQFARSISPVRKRGNYLLCSLLLGNVLVNSTLTILLDQLTSGIIAVISSTLAIVIFGEIIPQAICSRHGLAVGARTVYLTYIFMFATFPLSFPISKILDKVLGEEIGNVYDRERLMEYIRVTKDYNRLEQDEVNIISGALKLTKIKVVEIMTPIQDVYMLPFDAKLNSDTINEIQKTGYSRIPIFENERDNVVALLHVKDLAFIDPDDNLALKTLIDLYKHPLYFVYEDVTLDVMLNEFKQGKSHMAFVRRIIDDGVNDPYYELAGVVTLEDVIEELIQAEINDETDIVSDNRRKQKRKEASTRPNYSDFIRLGTQDLNEKNRSTHHLDLATFNSKNSIEL